MKVSREKPGFFVSATLHATLLAATLLAFAEARKFEDAQELTPVEVVVDAQLNEIMKGEKTARAAKPATRVDKVAPQPTPHPEPPQAEAKQDVVLPPPQFKHANDPNEEEAPETPENANVTPPKREVAAKPAEAAPTPPPRPQAKTTPEPEKQEPEEAEVVKPKPPTKPKLEEAKETPTPPEKPKLEKVEKPAEKAKATPHVKLDEVAKLLEQKQTEPHEKAGKPKSGDETAPKSRLNANEIRNFLDHQPLQQRAATGVATQTASLGAPTASAARMSPSLQGKIDSYTVEHYRPCWKAALSMNAMSYVPRIEFRLTRTGALEAPPRLLNPSSSPLEAARGEQAIAAVRRCSPMPIPPEFAPYYEYWRITELDMKDDM